MNNLIWHRRFIQMAGLVSTWSRDPSTRVGCVIVRPDGWMVISTGVNGFPRGVQEHNMVKDGTSHHLIQDGLHVERWQRPMKYQFVEHAERNAVYNAASIGVSTKGCFAYMNWSPCPCADCARALIQAGISSVIGPNRPFGGKGDWDESMEVGRIMFREAGVRILKVDL